MWIAVLLICVTIIAAKLKAWRQRDIANVAAAELRLDDRHGELSQAKEELKRVETEWAPAFDSFNAIDIETTGLSKAKSKIIQIAVVSFFGGRVANTWSTYLNPGIPIPENAIKVNNITNQMVASAPLFGDIMADLQRRLESNPLVAHNLKFDTDILMAEFSKRNVSWYPWYGYCTMRMARGAPTSEPPREERTFYSKKKRRNVTYTVRGRAPWLTLEVLMKQQGVRPIGKLHDARNDAIGCGEAFVAQGLEAMRAANSAVLASTESVTTAQAAVNKAIRQRRRWKV